MRGINKVILLGNVGKELEVGSDANGKPIARFSLVTSRSVGGSEEQTWHQVECSGRLAEIIGQYAEKGRALYLEGRLDTRTTYGETPDVFVVADTIQLLRFPSTEKIRFPTPGLYVEIQPTGRIRSPQQTPDQIQFIKDVYGSLENAAAVSLADAHATLFGEPDGDDSAEEP